MTDPTADPGHEQLWRLRDVATFLDVAPSAVYRVRREHGLPTVRIGGTMRFRPASVRAWAAARESTDVLDTDLKADQLAPRRRPQRHPVHLPPVQLLQ